MKKKIFGGIALLAIAATAAWNVNLNSRSDKLSSVSLANVEALAQESTPATCTFGVVYKDQSENKPDCSGNGTLCCVMN